MNGSSIRLRSINDLLTDTDGKPMRFRIPAYQRGYRWKALQVRQLLDDVWEFINPDDPNLAPKPNEFYCLQPLVTLPLGKGIYEVVDGQQRLTTIFLILHFLNRRFSAEFQRIFYEIDFETRNGFADFLLDPSEKAARRNIDLHHLFHAIQAIQDWFSNRQNHINDIESALLNQTKVIWFELGPRDSPVDAFTRLNVGKIPLTNDELIRALFLRSKPGSSDGDDQLRIAHEWDQLEKALQADEFWCFLNNDIRRKQNRIEFLFTLAVPSETRPNGSDDDSYAIFYAFNRKLNEPDASTRDEWRKIKEIFMTLEEWYENPVLYHIVGFLIEQGVSIAALGRKSESGTKSEFDAALRQMVYDRMIASGVIAEMNSATLEERVRDKVESLEYGRDSGMIRSLLLLFNIATLIEDSRSNIRFGFDSFKKQVWNIEHVRSVANDQPVRHSDRKRWLEHALRYLVSMNRKKDRKLSHAIAEYVKKSQTEADDDEFETLYESILKVFKESSDKAPDNGIGNLTLLDEGTNKSYKNAVFAVKRQRLLELDQAGIFVPLCTRNVFLKCYNPQVDNVIFWSEDDRDCYRNALVGTLVRFFRGRKEAV